MEKLKLYKIAVVLLLLLNIGTLAFLWLNRPPAPEARGPFSFLVKATEMDEKQAVGYRSLRDDHRSKMEDFRKQNGQIRAKLFELLGKNGPNDPEIAPFLDSIATLRRQEEQLTYTHFRQVRELCRPDQQAKFDAVIVEAVQNMRPPRR